MATAAAGGSERRRGAMPRLWQFAAEYLLLLPAGAAIALVWANLGPESYFNATLGIEFFVNDVAMVLFFGLIMKEVAEATARDGVLHPWRRAILPLVAAVGMTLVPLAAFWLIVPLFDEPRVFQGWPTVFATDLAVGYLFARLVYGRHPVIPFFLLLAICADALGIAALASIAPRETVHVLAFVLLMTAAVGVLWILKRAKVQSFWPYVLLGGSLSWSALYFSGIEPALALIPVVPFLPHGQRDPGFFVDASPSAHDALSRFELWIRHPAQVALFLFGLVNAGFQLKSLYWGTLSLPIALFVAKPVGLVVGASAARALGLHMPESVGVRDLFILGFVATIGFTMALFFATGAVGPGPTLSEIKMGALVTLAAGPIAILLGMAFRAGRFGR